MNHKLELVIFFLVVLLGAGTILSLNQPIAPSQHAITNQIQLVEPHMIPMIIVDDHGNVIGYMNPITGDLMKDDTPISLITGRP